MMLPHTITLWNRADDETYTRTVINGVLWEESRGVQLRKNGVSADNGIFVTIPFESTPGSFVVRPQDFMAKGNISLEPKTAKDLLAVGAVMVSAADKFDFGSLPHWEVTGK